MLLDVRLELAVSLRFWIFSIDFAVSFRTYHRFWVEAARTYLTTSRGMQKRDNLHLQTIYFLPQVQDQLSAKQPN